MDNLVKSYLLRLWRRQGRTKVVFDVIVIVTSCFFQADFTNSDLMVSGGVVRFDFAILVHSNEVLVGSGIGKNVLDWNNREILCNVYKFSTVGPRSNRLSLGPKTPFMPFLTKTEVR